MPAKQSAVRHTNDENANKRVWAGTRCGNVTANRICSAVDCANLCRTRFPLPNRIPRNKQNKRHARFSSTTRYFTCYLLLPTTRLNSILIGSGLDIFSPRSDSKGEASFNCTRHAGCFYQWHRGDFKSGARGRRRGRRRERRSSGQAKKEKRNSNMPGRYLCHEIPRRHSVAVFVYSWQCGEK